MIEELAIDQIVILDRQRQEYRNVDQLAESIRAIGLIQPVVINHQNQLIAGGRRIKAHQLLGLKSVKVVRQETLTPEQLAEMELDENVQREDLTWQERTIAVYRIHNLKASRGALEGTRWTQRQTGALYGMSLAHVNNMLSVAERLLSDKDSPLWKAENITDALRLILLEKENALLRLHATRAAGFTPTVALPVAAPKVQTPVPDALPTATQTVENVEKESARERYLSNPLNDPTEFEEYWQEKNAYVRQASQTITVLNRLTQGDCLEYLAASPECCDHIITDPPYAIDMENLSESDREPGSVESVAAEHEVEANLKLLQHFIPLAYTALRPKGFFVMWCDQQWWDFCYIHAMQVGFRVQRWPFVWCKQGMNSNNCAQYNMTKRTEIAMICRKESATLAQATSCNYLVADFGNEDKEDLSSHPFKKPYACWKYLIEATTIKGQTVLDPFAGQGSSILALAKLGRQFLGCELSDEHYPKLVANVRTYYEKLFSTAIIV